MVCGLESECALGRSLRRRVMSYLTFLSYGGSGEQLINITYVGDTLIATKVTGDVNVPRGETSFTVNLSPGNNSDAMEPLRVPLENGVKLVTRYAGKGQIAQENFTKKRFVEGMFLPSVGQGSVGTSLIWSYRDVLYSQTVDRSSHSFGYRRVITLCSVGHRLRR